MILFSPLIQSMLLLTGTFCISIPRGDDAGTVGVATLPSSLRLFADQALDQDDHCIWRDAEKPEDSLIICSDKSADHLFVYTLTGELRQRIPVPQPGNIDILQNVVWEGEPIDVVAVNQREPEPRLRVFLVDRKTRRLVPVDEDIATAENYGDCLFHNKEQGRLYFITTSKSGVIGQYELTRIGNGRVHGSLVRSWKQEFCEGAVADDRTGTLYIAEEQGNLEDRSEPERRNGGSPSDRPWRV